MPLDGQRAPDPPFLPKRYVSRRSHLIGILGAVVGLALFAWSVRSVGASEIWAGLRAIGWGLTAIIAVAGLRFALRAVAWSICIEPPHRLPFAAAFPAVLAGDAVGNLTPLGLLASEPTKAAFIRQWLPLAESLPALAVENIFYTLSVAAMIAASTVALLVGFTLPGGIRRAALTAVAAIFVGFVVTAWLLWQRQALVSRIVSAFVPKSSHLHARLDRLHELETQIYTFTIRRRAALIPVIAAELGFHALGVLEIWITWWLMQGSPPPLLVAFILEGANRLIVVLFKFMPLQPGVAEWTTGSFTQLLGYGTAVGVTLSIVRKVRVIFWVLVGTALLIRRGFGTRSGKRT